MMEYTAENDSVLLNLALSGDREAEEALVERYMRLVRSCARPLFLAGGDSEDLIQEGMIGLLAAIRQFDFSDGTSFRTFAEHCVRMRLYSAIKSASRLKHLPLNNGVSLEQLSEDSPMQLSAIPDALLCNPEELVLARERTEELYSELAQCLSRMEKQVLSLYREGYSYREIAAHLGKEEKSIDNAVQRIRRKLARNPIFGEIS
ncbi:MAG: sigma-70 family RNA polymerase sigma factor [Oscillospiraceae bacterium]|nr:sigma-70 family RNA polymerase sigma factor [Oscillospiraceae bacterium]